MAFRRLVPFTGFIGTPKGKALQFLLVTSFLFIFILSSISVPWSLQSSHASTVTQVPPTGSYFDHIVTIIMENQGIQNICGQGPPPCNGPYSPTLSALANNYGISAQFLSINP